VIIAGFTGVGFIIPNNNSISTRIFRFVNADLTLTQGVNTYLPSYGGSQLVRIVSPTTGDVTGRISFILVENSASYWYSMAYDAEPFDLYLKYYNGICRVFKSTYINTLAFSCKAGSLVEMSLDTISKEHDDYSGSISDPAYDAMNFPYTITEKLVNWTKVSIQNLFDSSIELSDITYNINNNLRVIKTAESLLPSLINRGIQEVTGTVSTFGANKPMYAAQENEIFNALVTFSFDNLVIEHKIINHWSYRTPLSANLISTSLDWTRVDTVNPPTVTL